MEPGCSAVPAEAQWPITSSQPVGYGRRSDFSPESSKHRRHIAGPSRAHAIEGLGTLVRHGTESPGGWPRSASTEPMVNGRAPVPLFQLAQARSPPRPFRRPGPRWCSGIRERRPPQCTPGKSADASSAWISQSTVKNCPLASIHSAQRLGVTMGEPSPEPETFASKLSYLRAISAPLPGANKSFFSMI